MESARPAFAVSDIHDVASGFLFMAFALGVHRPDVAPALVF